METDSPMVIQRPPPTSLQIMGSVNDRVDEEQTNTVQTNTV